MIPGVSNVLWTRYLAGQDKRQSFVARLPLRCGGRSEYAEPIKGELKGSCFQTSSCPLDDKKSSDFHSLRCRVHCVRGVGGTV